MAVKGSLRFVYAHFPIKASIGNNNKSIKIRNFLGEKKRHVGARSYFEKREASLVWSYRHAGIDLFLGRLLFVLPA
ncbi:hypothetical protein AAZX31_14G146900 [Glycine max]|uniref:Ribosomal protein L6 alpha-beta domain-containing protein n=2 Tax=Glycine subgen. Soja TaxID=1462606 RepID=K7M788_SOYBN|nr:hypothetical protein GLYMA_14G122100v4 [Glycine max]RZB69221.1 hypothetical protein D0Y65_038827 [Glycine soja]